MRRLRPEARSCIAPHPQVTRDAEARGILRCSGRFMGETGDGDPAPRNNAPQAGDNEKTKAADRPKGGDCVVPRDQARALQRLRRLQGTLQARRL